MRKVERSGALADGGERKTTAPLSISPLHHGPVEATVIDPGVGVALLHVQPLLPVDLGARHARERAAARLRDVHVVQETRVLGLR